MSKLLVAVLGALLVVMVGCQNKQGDDAQMMSADACPACEGVQKATADGKCAACEAKKAKAEATGAGASADACAHCAGVQTVTADGKCSACGAEVAAK
jgi:uncharacterized lipoprotein NlpE involved in copper resistance